ncbi:endonuclease/exonuclease/phosphatase family protein [Carboxylicivirga sp. RSCT41]|uniref:endonuclease/exonuclease/phosphatase family protein n=1 Tax=Carboxylicivirga agarovorans TaxID=3417570 RepID=UPI003D3391B9
MRKSKITSSFLTLISLFFIAQFTIAQSITGEYAIMFYNVENLFDCENDSQKQDDEFTPDGNKNWNNYRLYNKIKGLGRTIVAVNEWNPPAIIGLCEVENDDILKKLIYSTGLYNLNYKYIHYESMDKRGIDVALLYRKGFSPIKSSPILLSDTTEHFFTRDALYVKGAISGDTLHIIVNHWPSKRGGELASETKREMVAKVIASKIDSIKHTDQHAKLVIIGDFNAEMNSPSLQYLLTRSKTDSQLKAREIRMDKVQGSHKYKGTWSLIDHILISETWLNNPVYGFDHRIVSLPFLLETDNTYSGSKPHRTYTGPRYVGGISDHLPVIIKIHKN